MTLDELTIDPASLWHGERMTDQPVAFVDLASASQWADELVLPACPVIGLGDPAHPTVGMLDAVIESPVTIDQILKQVTEKPNAAAVIVQLLRLLPSLGDQDALTAESMAYAMLQGSAEHLGWIAARGASEATPRTPGEVVLARDGGVLTITLDHPDSGNAIDRHMRDRLHEAFALAAIDASVETIMLRANGKTFSLGADLDEFGTTLDPAAHAIRWHTLPARKAALCKDRLEVHVQGGCVGSGLELAGWGRRITASRSAWFQLPELAMGILPGAGGCVSLSRRIGRQRTALLILSGKRLSARHALDWGLIDAIVDEPA